MLNPQQLAAVRYLAGPLLVLAGAGSGKTRVITQKIAYLIEHAKVPAHRITAVTFTHKAAHEMRARVASAIPSTSRRGLQVATFHTLGLRIIKRHLQECGRSKGFSIFDQEDSIQLLRNGCLPAQANDNEYLMAIQQQLSAWKNALLSPEEVLERQHTTEFTREIAPMYARYQDALLAYNAVDFDDLIRLPVALLRAHPDILTIWQQKINYLLVDEYQDSNPGQYALIQLLVGSSGKLTVVGDDDQSIYAWRGARPENLLHLQQDYPDLNVIKLEQNYRSTRNILRAANQLITHNPHVFAKQLWSELGVGDAIRILCCKDEQEEAEQVVTDMLSHSLRTGSSYGNYALLYRSNHQSRVFETVLRYHSIPYRISGGQSWFAKTEIKDILAYLRLLCNPNDDAAFLRIINTPKRGIGDTTLMALGKYAKNRQQSLLGCSDHLALSIHLSEKPREALEYFKQWLSRLEQRCNSRESVMSAMHELIESSGYEAHIYELSDSPQQAQKRMENVLELIVWVGKLLDKTPDRTLADVINTLLLIDRLEQAEESDPNTLQLMTLHASKGLEFPHVYLIGMEEGILPHRVSIEADQIEEERRLAYVGITRAQKSLCMSLARQRRRAGELHECLPSRFLAELPEDVVEWFGKSGERNEERSKALAQSHLTDLRRMLTGAGSA